MIDATTAAAKGEVYITPRRKAQTKVQELGARRRPPRATPESKARKSEWKASTLSPLASRENIFTAEHLDYLGRFMTNHVSALNNIERRMREDFDAENAGRVLRGQPALNWNNENPFLQAGHEHEREWLDSFRKGDGTPDQEQIEAYLRTERGRGSAIIMMEEVAFKVRAARDLSSTMNGAEAANRNTHLHTGAGRGSLQEFLDNHPDLRVIIGTGVIPPIIVKTWQWMTEGGATLKSTKGAKDESDAFRGFILLNNSEQRYWQYGYGIDARNQTFTTAGAYKDEQILEMMYFRYRVLNEVFNMPPGEIWDLPRFMYTRRPRDVTRPYRFMMPFFLRRWQRLRGWGAETQGETENPPWREDIMNQMQHLDATEGAPANDIANVFRGFRAARDVLMRYHNEAWDMAYREPTRGKNLENAIKKLDERIKAMGKSATAEQKRNLNNRLRTLAQTRDALEAIRKGEDTDKPGLDGERQPFNVYQEALENIDRLREEARRVFGTDDLEAINAMVDHMPDEAAQSTLRTALQNAETAMTGLRSQARQIQADFNDGMAQFDRFTTPLGGGGLGFSQDELANWSYELLLREVNIRGGWPASANQEPQNRLNLLQAIAEARARRVNPDVAPNPGSILERIIVSGVAREEDLWSLTPGQLEEMFRRQGINIPPPLTVADLPTALAQARNRLITRSNNIVRVFNAEAQRVTVHNREVEDQQGRRNRSIDALNGLIETIGNDEADLERRRNNTSQTAQEFLDQRTQTYNNALTRLNGWRTSLATATPPLLTVRDTLLLENLGSLTFTDILNRIHAAYAANPALGVGWAAGDPQDTNPDTYRMIMSVKAEADARRDAPDAFTDLATLAFADLRARNITDDRIRRLNPENALATVITELMRGGSTLDFTDQGVIADLSNAIDLIRNRYPLRQQALARALESTPAAREHLASLNSEYTTINDRLDRNRDTARNHLTAGTDPTVANMRTRIGNLQIELRNFERYEPIDGELNPRRERIESYQRALDTLRDARDTVAAIPDTQRVGLRNTLRDAEAALASTTDPVQRVVQETRTWNTDYERIIAIDAALPVAQQVGLLAADLATQPFEVLVQRVNEANRRARTLGLTNIDAWGEGENNDHALRMRLMHAVIQARTNTTIATQLGLPANINANNRFGDLATVTAAGVTDHFIRTGNVNGVMRELNRRGLRIAMLGVDLDPTNNIHRNLVQDTIDLTRIQYNAQRTTLNNIITETEVRGRNMAETLNMERGSLEALRDFLRQYPTLRDNMQEIARNINRFTDVTEVNDPTVSANYSQQELDAMGLVGVDNLIDFLIPYQQLEGENRGERFQRITGPNGALPARLVMESFNQSLNLGLVPPFTANLFLTRVRERFDQRRISDPALWRRAVQNLTDNRVALALSN